MKIEKPFPFHPLLFAAFPVLALLRNNLGQIEPSAALRPLAISVAAALTVLVLVWAVGRNWRSAGILVTLVVVLWFTFGQVYDVSRGISLGGVRPFRLTTLSGLYLVLFGLGTWLVLRSRSNFASLTQLLNLVGLFLVGFSLVQIGAHVTRYAALSGAQAQSDSLLTPKDPAHAPDIYYLVLDSYSRADIIQEMGFDNRPFLDELKALGFVVAECAPANYEYTEYSMAATLNMDYIQRFGKNFVSGGADYLLLEKLIQHGEVRRLLEDAGYRTVGFATGFPWNEWKDADVYLEPTENNKLLQSFTPFENLLLRSSAFRLVTDAPFIRERLNAKMLQTSFNYDRNVRLERYVFDQLETVTAFAGPKFVYAHIMTPHDPILFDENGAVISDPAFFPPAGQQLPPGYFTKGAVWEFQYTNKRVLTIVKNILAQSHNPPIILIQGDHGRSSPRNAILSAYYLPEGGNRQIDDHISPVNSFRVIFDTYFGTHFGRLADVSYRVEKDQPGVFTVLKDPNPACR
jgi:hypothetical protein